jgi:hypothetical protein
MAECYVSAADYARYWGSGSATTQPRYSGPERRSGQERRAPVHERRWDRQRGRRFALGERRQPVR